MDLEVKQLKKDRAASDRRVVELEKDLKLSEQAKEVSLEKVKKQDDVAELLRDEVDRERSLSARLRDDVKVLEECLSCMKVPGHAAARQYSNMLGAFGGMTEALAPDSPVLDVLKWLSNNFLNLSDFIDKARDFAALSGVTNLLSMLEMVGCKHMEDFC